MTCPQDQDGALVVEWIGFPSGPGGEWWLQCPACGAQNFLLDREGRTRPDGEYGQ